MMNDWRAQVKSVRKIFRGRERERERFEAHSIIIKLNSCSIALKMKLGTPKRPKESSLIKYTLNLYAYK